MMNIPSYYRVYNNVLVEVHRDMIHRTTDKEFLYINFFDNVYRLEYKSINVHWGICRCIDGEFYSCPLPLEYQTIRNEYNSYNYRKFKKLLKTITNEVF